MTTPTQIAIPGADFTASPVSWVLPTSVAPSYLGVFGGSLARTLQNGASAAAAPSSIIGSGPTISSGYATFAGGPDAGIQTPQLETASYTWMGVIKPVTFASAGNQAAPVFGDGTESPSNNMYILYYSSINALTLVQFGVGGNAGGTLNPSSGALNAWGMYSFTGQSGVGVTGQILTAGQTNSVLSFASANAFNLGVNPFKIGAGSAAASIGAAIMAFWPSVLSAQDMAAAAGWMRKLAAKGGITV